jgi:phage portal protein BeeE
VNILARLFPRRPEARAFLGGPGWTLGNGGTSTANQNVAAMENLAGITGAVELLANSIASLPATITVDTADGREPMPGAAATRLLVRPNPRQSWPAFVTAVVSSVLLQGNAVVMLGTDGRGAVSSLTPVPWPWLLPTIVGGAAGARLAFDLVYQTPEA